MTRLSTVLAAALVFAAPSAFAEMLKHGDLMIDTPYSFATPATAKSAAGYMVITNTGDTDELLVSAESSLGRTTQLHLSETDANGVARMIHQEQGIAIRAGETVTLEPGGYHVMFMGVSEPLAEGEEATVTLVFEQAGALELTLPVIARGDKAGHGGHGDGHGEGHGDGHDH